MTRGRRTRGRGAALALSGFCVLAPQLLGGATELTHLGVVAAAALVCVACALTVRRDDAGSAPLAVQAAVIAATWTAVQALPLPCGWIAWAQPDRSALASELVSLGLFEQPACSLSLAPGATRGLLGLASVLLALLLSAVALARAGQRSTLLRGIALSAVLMACVALGHGLVDAHSVFGVYTPEHAQPQLLLAPLMNENSLAGFLALGFPVCLGVARGSEITHRAVLWWLGAAATFVAGLLTLSRAGAAAILGAGGIFVVLELRQSRGRRRALAALAAMVGIVACFGVLATDRIAKQFDASRQPLFHKVDLAMQLGASVVEHPWAGIGRGAVQDLSARVLVQNRRMAFVENLPVQWVLEWGLPLGTVLLVLFVLSLLRARPRRASERGLLCGFVALVLQNLFDNGLELPGVACVAAVALGVLVSRERPGRESAFLPAWPAGALGSPRALAVCAAVAPLAVVLASPWLTSRSRAALERGIAAGIASGDATGRLRERLATALQSYPFDATFVTLASGLAVRDGAADAPRWLNLAFSAAPGWALPHVQAASYLEARRNVAQASIELSLATAIDPSQYQTACAFIKRHPRASVALAVAPVGIARDQELAETLVDCLMQVGAWAEADEALEQLVERYPASAYVHTHLVLAAGQQGKEALALSRARAMMQALPQDTASLATYAQVLTAHGRAEEAMRMIDSAIPSIRQDRSVLVAQARAAAALRDEHRLDGVLDELLVRYGHASRDRAHFLHFSAELRESLGNHFRAVSDARASYELSGDADVLELAHRAAISGGLMSAALRTAAQMCNLGHRGRKYCGGTISRSGAAP